ncbi:MAG: bifunctional precorrin-2 dehydrogenase/sirohydrochlorin ferrochelatase, partial [Deltaproteobacteria bacterium]|nr:bifunctional precorrin-2 dehydrogenase/sirohydrochlorin ferrochelatase [Deltaproteobacteria bacterium]
MRYYPVFLDIKGRQSLVIGGGAVALRKIEGLLSAGSKVTVVSPTVTKAVKGLADKGSISLIKRKYREGDLVGVFLVVTASNDRAVNESVYNEAKKRGVLINSVDAPERCSFIVPSIIDRDPLLIAVSTSGAAPLLAKKIRERLEGEIGEEYGKFTDLIGKVRNKLLKSNIDRVKKESVIKALVNSPIPVWI